MAMEPKRAHTYDNSPRPFFSPLSEVYQFMTGEDPEYNYADLGHLDQLWARRLYRQKVKPDDGVNYRPVRNRPVPFGQREMPRREEDWWGYIEPKAPGMFVVAERQPVTVERNPGPLERIVRGFRILTGR